MRVTLVSETYFPQLNGVSRTLGQLVRVLEEAGDTVQLVIPDYEAAHQRDQVVPVRCVHPPFYKELYLPVPPFGTVRRAIERFDPDIVHIATEATLGLAVLRYLRSGPLRSRIVPVVSSFHTNFDQYAAHYRVPFLKAPAWRYMRWFHNRTRETYVPSRATIADLESRGFANLVLWPRGVDSRLFRPDRPGRATVRTRLGIGPEEVVVGHVSRIAAEKNVAYLGAALERVAAARPACRFLVVGDGPARPELERQLGTAARFVGYRTGEDLADHFASCDIFAFASLTETFGNVVLEAMASGLPVVAVRAGGPGDTVQPGRTGFLVEPEEPPEVFAARVIELADRAADRERLAKGARDHACTQSWDAIMLGLRDRYLEQRTRADRECPPGHRA